MHLFHGHGTALPDRRRRRILRPAPYLNGVEAASDIHLDVRSVPYQKLSALESGEPSSAIRLRVEAARTVQKDRFTALGKAGVLVNGDMGPSEVQKYCALDDA